MRGETPAIMAPWILLLVAISGFAAWACAEFINRKWLAPHKRYLKLTNNPPASWYWTGVVGSFAVIAGTLSGVAVAAWDATPFSLEVGAVLGFASGCAPVWIVKEARKRIERL